MGSTSDDWIYLQLVTHSLLITLKYKHYQHYSSFTPFTIQRCSRTRVSLTPLVVSQQRLSTHNYNSFTLQLLHISQSCNHTSILPRLSATDHTRELHGVLPMSRHITSAPTAQKTSHAFLIFACRPIAAELRSSVQMCLPLRCVATFATRTL
jgi:hypothetical protein